MPDASTFPYQPTAWPTCCTWRTFALLHFNHSKHRNETGCSGVDGGWVVTTIASGPVYVSTCNKSYQDLLPMGPACTGICPSIELLLVWLSYGSFVLSGNHRTRSNYLLRRNGSFGKLFSPIGSVPGVPVCTFGTWTDALEVWVCFCGWQGLIVYLSFSLKGLLIGFEYGTHQWIKTDVSCIWKAV